MSRLRFRSRPKRHRAGPVRGAPGRGAGVLTALGGVIASLAGWARSTIRARGVLHTHLPVRGTLRFVVARVRGVLGTFLPSGLQLTGLSRGASQRARTLKMRLVYWVAPTRLTGRLEGVATAAVRAVAQLVGVSRLATLRVIGAALTVEIRVKAFMAGKSRVSVRNRGAALDVPINPAAEWPAGITQWIEPLAESTGTIFYAAPNGDDANPGTLAQPWRCDTYESLNAKVNGLVAGQRLQFRAGTYGERAHTLLFSRVGTSAGVITLEGYPGDAMPTFLGAFEMTGQWIRMRRILFDGPTGNVGSGGPLGNAIIVILKGSHLEFSYNEARHGYWHAAVGADGAFDYRVLCNYIHDSGGGNGTPSGPFGENDRYGCYWAEDAQNNTSHGSYVSPSSYGLIANNIFDHNDAKGLMGRHDAHHLIVVNNLFVGNGRQGVESYEQSHDWIVANNIAINNGQTKGGSGVSMQGVGPYFCHRNIAFNNGTNGTSNWNYNSATWWPTVGLTDYEDLTADPMIVAPADSTDTDPENLWQHPDPQAEDNHLQIGSPAVGYADPNYTLPFDILGHFRGAQPDCGPYELLPAAGGGFIFDEPFDTGDGTAGPYSHDTVWQVLAGTVVIVAGTQRVYDDGQGHLVAGEGDALGTIPPQVGTIDYITGAVVITQFRDPTAGANYGQPVPVAEGTPITIQYES